MITLACHTIYWRRAMRAIWLQQAILQLYYLQLHTQTRSFSDNSPPACYSPLAPLIHLPPRPWNSIPISCTELFLSTE
jgi:hypothetical protein